MSISLDALAVLDAIERRGSFAAAAEELHRVPSALTYIVKKLEQELGVSLFDRSGHRAALTVPGKTLLEEGRYLLMAADQLEKRVRRVATGWEADLRIALSDLIPPERLYPLIEEFFRQEGCITHLRLLTEVYGGSWDALVTGRAELAIGAPGEGPPGGGMVSQPLGVVEFDFVVAPDHPLARAPEPLHESLICRYRAVSAADSSRNLSPRTSGLITGQEVLTVPDIHAKRAAHQAGLGVGYLPRAMAREDALAGKLVIKRVEAPKPANQLLVAWPTGRSGRARQWFVAALARDSVKRALLGA
jgi:DNA-binding transcriptional LysR family regulator